VLEPSTLGGWEVSAQDGRVRLTKPQGFDAPLSISTVVFVSAPSAPAALPAAAPAAAAPPPKPAFAAQAVPGALRFTLSAPARIEASLEGPGGSRKLPTRVLDAGDREIRLGDLFSKVLPKPGSYRIRLVATDTKGGRVQTEVPLDVAANARAVIPTSDALFGVPVVAASGAPVQPAGRILPGTGKGGGGIPLAYVVAVAAIALVALGVWRARVWLEGMEPLPPEGRPPPAPPAPDHWLSAVPEEPSGDGPKEPVATVPRPAIRMRRRRDAGGDGDGEQ